MTIEIKIIEKYDTHRGSIGGNVETYEIDNPENLNTILEKIKDAYRKTNKIDTPYAQFEITNDERGSLYYGTIHVSDEKVNFSWVKIS